MANQYIELDNKRNRRRIGMAIFTGIVVLGLSGYFGLQKYKPLAPLSNSSQASLIEVETKAVKNNAKPAQVIGSLYKEFNRLSSSNKELASDLMYTSVQNNAVYYNNATLLMSGEIEYNAHKNNSLSAGQSSAWVLGFLQDIENNTLHSYNLNKKRILALPDFAELLDKTKGGASDELRDYLEIGTKVEQIKVFTENEINVVNAARAYQTVISGTATFAQKYPKSKYLSDLSSLARIYHDVAFGYVQTNNISLQKNGTYKLSRQHLAGLNKVASGNSALKTEARQYLAQVKGDTISAKYLKDGAQKSLKLYGSNVFWNSDTDISSLVNSDGTSNLNKK